MLTFGFGQPFGVSQRLLGYTAGSTVLAKILYAAPFTYTLDANGNNIIENQGSGADGLLYTGQGLEVLATQVFPIPIETSGHCVAMYDIINTQWVYVTATTAPSYTIPAGTYGHIAVLSIDPSVADKAYLENNIDAIKDLWFGRATGLTSIVKANIQHLYIHDVLQGAYLQDLCSALGSLASATDPFADGSLIAKYELNNNANDTLGRTVGTINSTTWDASGKFGQCAKIPSTPTSAGIAIDSLTNNIYSTSVFAYINSGDTQVTTRYLIDNRQGQPSRIAGYISVSSTNTIGYITSRAGNVRLNGVPIANGSPLPTDVWFSIYFEELQSNIDLGYVSNGSKIGNYYDAATLPFNGLIDQVEYYNRRLSNVEVFELCLQAKALNLPNYAPTMHLNANQDANAQQTASTLFDATGRATGIDYDNLNFYSLGYLDTQTNLSLLGNFWLDEIIGTTIYQHHYNGTTLITYTNNVAGTAVAHTPENAMYKLGKGLYPKVTADPYATYKHKHFQVENGALYLVYNQATRYTELGGI